MRLLLATDGREGSIGAIRMAIALEHDAGAEVIVMRAVQPIPLYGPASSPLHVMPIGPAIEEASRAAEIELDRLLRSVDPATDRWRAKLEVGPPPATIARTAEREAASLIVLGLGRHERVDRWLGTETALRVVQLAHAPVLAVPADAPGRRPRKAVVAVDFSDFSRAALEMAARTCGAGSELHLVYVLSVPEDLVHIAELDAANAYHDRIEAELRDWAKEAALNAEVDLVFHPLEGKIADEILAFGDAIDADLIVAGSHGMGFIARTVLGSVSTKLVRGSTRPVLIVVPPGRVDGLGADNT